MSADFRFIAGLGNPGAEYDRTRHNVGFDLVDRIAERAGGAPRWKQRDGAHVLEVDFAGGRAALIKPLEFMNLSGRSIARLLNFVKASPEQLVVVHDDIDLSFGMIRIRGEGGDGGHRGIRSIMTELGADNFVRVKLGVGRPGAGEVADWVLSRFSKEEERDLSAFLDRAIEAVETIFKDGVKTAQNRFNTKNKAARENGGPQ